MYKASLCLLVWALLPSIFMSQNIIQANTHGNFNSIYKMFFSPDKEQMLAFVFNKVYFIKRNGNLYNETIQDEDYEIPAYAEFTPDGQYLYIVQQNGLARVLQKNSSSLWEKKI